MQSLLNGILSYGLVNVPVGVCTAASRSEKTFKTLHAECLMPIASPKECPTCQKSNLSSGELVRAFEFTKGNYVVVDPEIMGDITPTRTGVIALDKCVEWNELDEMYVERSYYLKPQEMLVQQYQILATALGAKEACGIGKAVLWKKQYPIAVWARENGVLVLSMLYEHDEVRADDEIVQVFGAVKEEHQELGNQWVAAMIRDLNPQEDLVTEQRTLTDEYIASLISGSQFVVPERGPELTPTTNIEDALARSIELARVAA